MKRPEYVACATDACRKALSGEPYDKERLAGIFSRGGLTESYYTGTMRDMQGIRGKDDVENSAKALSGIKELYRSEYPRIKADISVEIAENKPIAAAAKCSFGEVRVISDILPEKASAKPLDEASVIERMSKLGNTQFFSGNITAAVGEGLYVAAAQLNSLRRELCEKLEETVLEKCTPKYEITPFEFSKMITAIKNERVDFRAEIATKNQLEQALQLDFGLIYAPIGLLGENTPQK